MSVSIHRIEAGKIIDAGTIDMSTPELPSEEACLRCGATSQSTEVWTETGESISIWYPMTNAETDEEGVVCRDCYLIINSILRHESRHARKRKS